MKEYSAFLATPTEETNQQFVGMGIHTAAELGGLDQWERRGGKKGFPSHLVGLTSFLNLWLSLLI